MGDKLEHFSLVVDLLFTIYARHIVHGILLKHISYGVNDIWN